MIKSINPYTGKLLGSYEVLEEKELYNKIDLAEAAYAEWKNTSLGYRCDLMRRVGAHLREKKQELGELMAKEMGKPVSQGVAEIEKCAWLCDYYADHAEDYLKENVVKTDAVNSYVSYEPLGVILAVMPWNYPFWQVFRFAVPTLLSGNTGLLKHASNVMGCAARIEGIFKACGFPEGVFQNLAIGSDMVELIIKHQAVKAVSLTGSDAAGRAVASLAGEHIKTSLLELGGSNAAVVLKDADLQKSAATIIKARFQNTGQSCIAAKRLLLHRDIEEEFMSIFLKMVSRLKSGDPLDPDTYIGVLAREDLAGELEDQLERSLEKGAELLCGGRREGAYFEPTVVKVDHTDMPVMQEETFGPLLAVYSCQDLEEAIRISNSTGFGLGVSIFTRDTSAILPKIKDFDEGAVFINEMVKSDPRLPFGGIKDSGYGRELGVEGIRAFVNTKTVYINR